MRVIRFWRGRVLALCGEADRRLVHVRRRCFGGICGQEYGIGTTKSQFKLYTHAVCPACLANVLRPSLIFEDFLYCFTQINGS